MRWVLLTGLVACGSFGTDNPDTSSNADASTTSTTDAATTSDSGAPTDSGTPPNDGGDPHDGGPAQGFLQAGSLDAYGAGPQVQFPFPSAQDSLLIVVVVTQPPNNSVTGITDGVGNSYVQTASAASGISCTNSLDVWHAKKAKAGATTINVSLAHTGAATVWIIEAAGFSALEVATKVSDAITVDMKASAPALAAQNGARFLVSSVAVCNPITGISQPTAYTDLPVAKTPGTVAEGVAWSVTTGSGEGAAWNDNQNGITFNAMTVAFKP